MKSLILALMIAMSSCAGVAHAQEDTPPIPPSGRRILVGPSGPASLLELLAGAEKHHLPVVEGQSSPPTILLEEDIDGDTASALGEALDKLAGKHPKVVRIVIGSGGGETEAGRAIAKMIERYPAKIVCVADGEVASMAFAVLESCDVRQMTSRSALMGHRSAARIDGMLTEDDLRSAADSVHATSVAMAQITCAKSKVKPEEFLKRTEGSKQWWILPEEALRLGFVDSVIPKVIW